MKQRLLNREVWFWAALLALGAAGVWLMRYITPYGLGLVNDSVGYIAGARGLLAGDGYSRLNGSYNVIPITNYPPMFSIALAGIALLGIEPIRAARLLNILCFAGNLMLTGFSVRQISSSRLWGVLSALLFLVCEPFLLIHSFALTEPLYLVLSYLALLLAARFAVTRRTWMLAAAGVITSLAFLTRLVGLSLYATAALLLLALLPDWRSRLRAWAWYLGFALPGAALWSLRNAWVAGNPSNRQLAYHAIPEDKIVEGLRNFGHFLLPNDAVAVSQSASWWGWLALALFFGLCAWVVLGLWRAWRTGGAAFAGRYGAALALCFAVQAVVYLGVVVVTLLFLDNSPIFEHRILSPFYICLFVLAFVALPALWRRQAAFKGLAAALLAAALVFNSLDTWKLTAQLHEYGQGFIGLQWRNSGVLQAVRDLPKITLFSNRPTAVYILADRPAYALLSPYNPATGEMRAEDQTLYDHIRQSVLDRQALLVIFDYAKLQASGEESWLLELADGLPLYGDYWDGAIFGALP